MLAQSLKYKSYVVEDRLCVLHALKLISLNIQLKSKVQKSFVLFDLEFKTHLIRFVRIYLFSM